jgi:hypothetical protein
MYYAGQLLALGEDEAVAAVDCPPDSSFAAQAITSRNDCRSAADVD